MFHRFHAHLFGRHAARRSDGPGELSFNEPRRTCIDPVLRERSGLDERQSIGAGFRKSIGRTVTKSSFFKCLTRRHAFGFGHEILKRFQ